jgi:hypothetical protein
MDIMNENYPKLADKSKLLKKLIRKSGEKVFKSQHHEYQDIYLKLIHVIVITNQP